ncbi:hypothetical protein Q9966_016655 [Columba livia]|nr:hypothetical protein Q9966_016655 [Columba livia]
MLCTAAVMAGSLALTTAVVAHAYYLKHQFYPTVVYLTKSSPSMAGESPPRFVALFTLLLFLKCFHWLAEDRVDFMERSPNISWLFHFRIVSLMFLLGVLDFLFVNHAYHSILTRGASVQLVFGFEYAILVTMVLTVFVKYVLHSIDLQNENPWDSKAVYMLYTELFTGFIKVLLYMAFMTIMIKVHTFPLFAIRPMYLAMRQFKKAVTDAIMSRRAIRNMNTLYPRRHRRGAAGRGQRLHHLPRGDGDGRQAPALQPHLPHQGLPPMPVPPAGFAGLTAEELRAMEGQERQHLEARLQCLHNIHTLLDAAMLQINQYLGVLATLGYATPAAG